MENLSQLLGELRQAGQTPDRALLDRVKVHGQAAVQPLIEMAVDEELNNAESDHPEVWAPLHAIQLLGELGAPEAVEPLLPFFDQVDDDYLAATLPDAFGGIGAPAVAPLRALLFDRRKDVWARIRAAESLGKIGQHHPETRSEVVSALVARLDAAESRVPEDEILNAFVISELLDLRAVEAAPSIQQAFEEDRVDTSVLDLDYALEELDLPRRSEAAQPAKPEGLRLRLRCTACQYEREHRVETIYYDLATHERREKSEPTPYSPFVIPQRIICPKCGAVDQYELSSMAYVTMMAEMLKLMVAHEKGEPDADPDESPLRLIRFGLADGREMHPYEAREMYRQQVEAEPNRADLRERYASVLRFLDHRVEAVEQYRAALRLEPANLEASLNLGRLARAAGDRTEAIRMFESVIKLAPVSGLPVREREEYVEAAAEELGELTGHPHSAVRAPLGHRKPVGTRGLAIAAPPPAKATRKVGRNDPCPCGSGKKYKKCHGR